MAKLRRLSTPEISYFDLQFVAAGRKISEANWQMHEEIVANVSRIVGDHWVVRCLNHVAFLIGDPERAADFGLEICDARGRLLHRRKVFQFAVHQDLLIRSELRFRERFVLAEPDHFATET